MIKSNPWKLFMVGLIFGLTACSSAAAGQPAPVQEAPVEVAAPAVETKTEAMPVEVTAQDEPAEKPAADASMTEVKESQPVMDEVKAETQESSETADEVMVKVEGNQPAVDEVKAETQENTAADEVMVKVEESQPAEAMAQPEAAPVAEEPALAETKPVEAETMNQETTLTKAGPTEAQAQLLASLGSRGLAPELNNELWLNSDPLKLANLHGKVVLIEFWTFG